MVCCSFLLPLDYEDIVGARMSEIKSDSRGELLEFVKHPAFGQVFVSRSRPGVTRGNHYHTHKVEKFLVVEGTAVILVRSVSSTSITGYRVHGEDLNIIDIPPMHVHSIQNVGDGDMVLVVWANEVFDEKNPDTFAEIV